MHMISFYIGMVCIEVNGWAKSRNFTLLLIYSVQLQGRYSELLTLPLQGIN